MLKVFKEVVDLMRAKHFLAPEVQTEKTPTPPSSPPEKKPETEPG